MADLEAEAVVELVDALGGETLEADDEGGDLELAVLGDDQDGVVQEELDLELLLALDQPGLGGLLALVEQVLGVLGGGVDLPDGVVEAVVVVLVEGLVDADPAVELEEVEPKWGLGYLPPLTSILASWKILSANFLTSCWMLLVRMS